MRRPERQKLLVGRRERNRRLQVHGRLSLIHVIREAVIR